MPVYPVVANAAFLTFFSSVGAAFLVLVDADEIPSRGPAALVPFRSGGRVLLLLPGTAVLEAVRAFRASSVFISLRSFIVSVRSIVLCWIFPSDSRCSELAFARAMISAYDRFFGGAEPVESARLGSGRDGNDLLPFAEDVPVPVALWPAGLGFSLFAGLAKEDREANEALSREAPRN